MRLNVKPSRLGGQDTDHHNQRLDARSHQRARSRLFPE
jgi:hypothetical protein